MINKHDVIELAKTAYNAYGNNRQWLTFDGREMPKWENIGEAIQIAWIAAVLAVKNVLKPDNPDRGIDA